MQKTDARPVGLVLASFLNRNPSFADKLAETRVINYWTRQLHPLIEKYTRCLSIRNKILYVGLNSSVLKNELVMRQEKLVLCLNKEVGKKVIDRIVFN